MSEVIGVSVMLECVKCFMVEEKRKRKRRMGANWGVLCSIPKLVI